MSKAPPATCDPSKRPNLHNGCCVVVGYTKAVLLGNVTTKVSKAGFERCRRERTRNVHAYLLGELLAAGTIYPAPPWPRLSYNCLSGPPCFVYRDRPTECFVAAKRVLALPGAVVYASPS